MRPLFLLLCFAVVSVSAAETIDLRTSIRFFEEKLKQDPDDIIAHNQLGERCLMMFRETGNDLWLERAGKEASDSLKFVSEDQNAGAAFLQAKVDLAMHRFAAARDRAKTLRDLQPMKVSPLEILGDALLEIGDLDGASKVYAEIPKIEGDSISSEPRFARLALARGQWDEAEKHFANALKFASELEPPSPVTVAWCHVQIGELAFRRGKWEDAEKSYQSAESVMPGWWSTMEHLAELRGAQGRSEEAIPLYEKVIANTSRPELMQALGDLHQTLNHKEEAKTWHDRALAAYSHAMEQGKVQYYHHLAGFYCDSVENPAEALKCALKDLELRQTPQAHDALAWAYYKNEKLTEAKNEIDKALDGGYRDAHLLYHAGLIKISTGDVTGGQAAMREAAEINPRMNTFHMHR